jgi:8-oxo-dGTP pyrophosphatase MutT (NUDIX family)
VSFPGGGEEAEDGGDLIATALRETQEEIGIPKSDVQVLGLFNECISLHGIIGSPSTTLNGCSGNFYF